MNIKNTLSITDMKYKIQKEEVVFDDFFQIKKADIEHDTFQGDTMTINRLCLERGDAVAILIYEKDTKSFLFTKQFRYPAIKEGQPWMLEVTAGMLEGDEDPIYRVKQEVKEEIGYQVQDIEFINSFFISPGGTSERIFLYYSEVFSKDKIAAGGGLKIEHEDIQLVKMNLAEVIKAYNDNAFRDGKTIMAIQWFLLHKQGKKL